MATDWDLIGGASYRREWTKPKPDKQAIDKVAQQGRSSQLNKRVRVVTPPPPQPYSDIYGGSAVAAGRVATGFGPAPEQVVDKEPDKEPDMPSGIHVIDDSTAADLQYEQNRAAVLREAAAKQREIDERNRQDREDEESARQAEQDRDQATQADDSPWAPATPTELFGYDPEFGGQRTIVGDLQAQLGEWSDLEGTFRTDYNWRTTGQPLTVKESLMFLQQAQNDPINQITFTQLSEDSSIVIQARRIQLMPDHYAAGGDMQQFAADIIRINDLEGGRLYTRGGQIVKDYDEMRQYDNMVAYKANAQVLIDKYRIGRQELMANAIDFGYQEDLERERSAGSAEVARINKESADNVAIIQKQQAKAVEEIRQSIANAQIAGRKEVAELQATGAVEVAKEQREGALDVATAQIAGTQKLAETQGTQEIARLDQQAVHDIANIEAKRDADLQVVEKEFTFRERMATSEQASMLARVDKESAAQHGLVQLSADLDMEFETAKQDWQAAESAKDRAIAEGNLQEAIRSNFMQEQITLEQQAIERETNSLNMLMNISQNPALLYFMKQSGMLSGIGPTILGEDTDSLIDDLTASIDPGNLPNIQTYNAMSELQQEIARFRTSATTGMSPMAQQEYLQGAAPFTRGQRSSIRIGSRANPFATMA